MAIKKGMYTVGDLVKMTARLSLVMFLVLSLLRLVLGTPAREMRGCEGVVEMTDGVKE